jgi:type II secretory pathway pseudopilin PulG
MLVLIFLLVLAAIAGVLGLVLKITLVVVLTVILATIALAAIAWFAVRHQWKKIQREANANASTIDVGRPVRSDGSQPLPGTRDDRY